MRGRALDPLQLVAARRPTSARAFRTVVRVPAAIDRDPERSGDREDERYRKRQPPPTRTPSRFLDQRLDLLGRRLWMCVRPRDTLFHGRHDGAIISSIMLDVKIDRGEPTELHEQVAAEIRRAIADGEAQPGERLPPARDLAAVLGVNTNTVLRAPRVLRDEGLLEFRRGRCITVAGSPERSAVTARARDLVRFARKHGYRVDELVRIMERVG